MATTPLRKCSSPGCRTLVRDGSRCPAHATNKGTTKNKPGDPFYCSAAWIKLRDYKRQQNPLCEECERQGRVRAMHAVDHIRPRREWPELELEYDNLQSLCEHCHNAVKQREERKTNRC